MLVSSKRKEGEKNSRKIVLTPPGKRGDWLQRVIALKVLMP